MKAFALILASILLPVASIGSLVYASILRLRDGAQAGILPDLLTALGCLLLLVLGMCIYHLQRLYTAKRTLPPESAGQVEREHHAHQ